MYRIGEFSKMSKLTVKTLRFYDEAGLLAPQYTDGCTGYRYYTTAQLYQAQQIMAFRCAGFSVAEIRRVLSGEDIARLLKEKLEALTYEKSQTELKLTRLAAIAEFYSEEQTMNYHVIVKRIPQCTVYYKRFKVKNFSEYGSIIPEIGRRISAVNPGLKCTVPDYCYVEYVDGEYRESDFTVEYAQSVERTGIETDGIRFKTLPETEAACALHRGAYDGLPKAYACVLSWIEQNGYVMCGNAREQYIDGIWNKDDEADYLTEVQFPVRKK